MTGSGSFDRRPPVWGAPARYLGAVEWQLLSTVYGQKASFYSSLAATLLAGAITAWRTASVLPWAWTAVASAVYALRILDLRAFARRRTEDPPRRWVRRFTAGAWAQAAMWGSASFVLLATDDPFTQFVVITVQIGFLAGAAARNNAVPAAALGQVYLTLLPLLLVCLLHPNRAYLLYSLLVLLQMAAAAATVRYLNHQTVSLLLANERNAALLRSLGSANAQLESANLRLQALATTDGLTGVANRRGFDAALEAEWLRATRDRGEMALLLADIDHFKSFNDRFGHQAGDDCLRRIARSLQTALRRPGDFVARYGGEEFAVLLPDTDPFGAIDIAERLRLAVLALDLPHPTGPEGRLTISVGAAALHPGDGSASGPGELVARADRELYRAKQSGRNRVRCAA
ncbi:MAG: GGDEF domain-containing protein [Rhodospirillales bacterium]|nr:GGDEF domain-containing protein [Rhodospirillales bacterium]